MKYEDPEVTWEKAHEMAAGEIRRAGKEPLENQRWWFDRTTELLFELMELEEGVPRAGCRGV